MTVPSVAAAVTNSLNLARIAPSRPRCTLGLPPVIRSDHLVCCGAAEVDPPPLPMATGRRAVVVRDVRFEHDEVTGHRVDGPGGPLSDESSLDDPDEEMVGGVTSARRRQRQVDEVSADVVGQTELMRLSGT